MFIFEFCLIFCGLSWIDLYCRKWFCKWNVCGYIDLWLIWNKINVEVSFFFLKLVKCEECVYKNCWFLYIWNVISRFIFYLNLIYIFLIFCIFCCNWFIVKCFFLKVELFFYFVNFWWDCFVKIFVCKDSEVIFYLLWVVLFIVVFWVDVKVIFWCKDKMC